MTPIDALPTYEEAEQRASELSKQFRRVWTDYEIIDVPGTASRYAHTVYAKGEKQMSTEWDQERFEAAVESERDVTPGRYRIHFSDEIGSSSALGSVFEQDGELRYKFDGVDKAPRVRYAIYNGNRFERIGDEQHNSRDSDVGSGDMGLAVSFGCLVGSWL